MTRRRRRRPAPESGRVVEDAFDLFLDALANTFGVIMFIALMIVIFAPPISAETRDETRVDATEAARVAALLRDAAALEAEIASLPPAGDPALATRRAELDHEIAAERERLAARLASIAERADAVRAAHREAREHLERTRELTARRAEVERRLAATATTTSFVRVSRFRDDLRRPLLLFVADGGVERVEPAPGQTRVVPGGPGSSARRGLETIEDARVAVDALLRGITPAGYRIEIGVWSDSFAEYKRLERVLVERGFDLNPMPLRAGDALDAGSGGIQ